VPSYFFKSASVNSCGPFYRHELSMRARRTKSGRERGTYQPRLNNVRPSPIRPLHAPKDILARNEVAQCTGHDEEQ
jgi:hypothetical protein